MRPLPRLYAVTLAVAAGMGGTIPVVSQWLESLGAGAGTVGLVGGVFGLAQVLVRIPIGRAVDRLGAGVTLRGSGIAFLAATALFLTAHDVPTIAAANAVFGLAIAAFWVAANTGVGAHAPAGQLNQTMAVYTLAAGAGFAAGVGFSALADVVQFRAVFLLLAVPGVFLLVLAPRGGHPAPAEAARVRWPRVVVWGLPLLTGLAFGVMDSFIPFHLRLLGYTAVSVALVLGAREMLGLATRVTLVRIAPRIATITLAVTGLALTAAGFVLVGLAGQLGLLMAAGGLLGIGISLVIPAGLTIATHASRAGATGVSMGLLGTLVAIGQTGGPPLLGYLAEVFARPSLPFVATAAATAAFGAVLLWARPRSN